MNDTPEPPNYPPYASWSPDPEVHVHITTDKPEEPAWDWSWMQLTTDAWTAALAFIPANIWAKVLHDVATQQGLDGAWFMGGASILVTAVRFGQRRNWMRRTMLWIAVLGCIFALPVFDAMVHVLTGGGR